ncbi:protein JINGUBANG [Senna tora]|uniref:Protein JINGUBANG n=1 Tax=Senna tora TaxID=362788 RepID=A0A834X1W7_9FABA|nr:protein JINGUBANG [Senna tora]
MNPHISKSKLSPPSSLSEASSSSTSRDDTPFSSNRFSHIPISKSPSYHHHHHPLAILSGHIGSVSCLSLCGEFVLSASHGKDIIVWQHPDLRPFTKFGQGDGSVKSVVTVGNKVFTAHQDGKIRVWKVSRRRRRSSEDDDDDVFKLVDTLPTTMDYLGKFMKQSNYVQTRRHHKRLWIEHSDSISCLAVSNGLIYSGSWDKTLKVWKMTNFKCLESIKAHEDAINGLVACKGVVYSASADGKIKAWGRKEGKMKKMTHFLKGVLEGHKDLSFNCVVVSQDGKWVYGGGSNGVVMGWEKTEKTLDESSSDLIKPFNDRSDLKNENWRLVFEMKAHGMAVLCMCLMREILFSGSSDKSIGIWKREGYGGKLCKIGVINGHEGPVKCLEATYSSRNGGGFMLYSGSLDKSLRVWWVPKYNEEEIEENSTTSLHQE